MSRSPLGRVRRPPALALLLVVALAGCGGPGDSSTTATTTTAPKPPKETRDPLPKRPQDWTPYVNERGGYALLLPRGWEAKPDGPQTLIRSYDRLVAISIAPDRSPDGLSAPLNDYATNTADELRGFEGGFDGKGMRRLKRHYDAVEVYGSGRSRDGVEQKASVIVVRRDAVATVTVVLAANARPAARPSFRIARRAIRTLRTRPPRST